MQHVRERRFKVVPEMEGRMARWYARTRGTASQLAAWREQAAQLTEHLPAGSAILEIAPGPGYLTVELATAGPFRVSGVDISRTMVEIADAYAGRCGVAVDFRRGDVADLPYQDGSFDLVVCQAAFKNFTAPARALAEMHRVLRPGGTAVIDDMRADATRADIAREVAAMHLTGLNARWTRTALGWLRRRAYTTAAMSRLAASSPFGGGDVQPAGIGLTLTLTRT